MGDGQQGVSDVVGLDREIWAITCSMYSHWQTDDETAVILQSLSHFSDGCRPMVACRNQVPLMAVAETWLKANWSKPKPGWKSFQRQFCRRNRSRSQNSSASTPLLTACPVLLCWNICLLEELVFCNNVFYSVWMSNVEQIYMAYCWSASSAPNINMYVCW